MCNGPIVDLPGKIREKAKGNFTGFLKKFWDKIIYYPAIIDSDQIKVNMCLKCGDLQIQEVWQKIPYPQKPIISKEIEIGRITINGSLTACDSCVSIKKEIRDKCKNPYLNRQANLMVFE